jgi:hypothetical protein
MPLFLVFFCRITKNKQLGLLAATGKSRKTIARKKPKFP